MSVLAKIVALWGSKSSSPRGKRLYIIDAAHLFSSGRGSRLSPRDQIHVLQKLSKFAEKEGISVQAVFEGRPLREVGHGEKFGGVTVFFAEKSGKLSDLVYDLFKKGRRRSAVVVTSNRDIEKKISGAGGATIRSATFRKGMEVGPSGGGNSSSQQRRRRRPPRPRSKEDSRERKKPERQKSSKPGGNSESDTVRDLIDLVE